MAPATIVLLENQHLGVMWQISPQLLSLSQDHFPGTQLRYRSLVIFNFTVKSNPWCEIEPMTWSYHRDNSWACQPRDCHSWCRSLGTGSIITEIMAVTRALLWLESQDYTYAWRWLKTLLCLESQEYTYGSGKRSSLARITEIHSWEWQEFFGWNHRNTLMHGSDKRSSLAGITRKHPWEWQELFFG